MGKFKKEDLYGSFWYNLSQSQVGKGFQADPTTNN